MPGRRLIGSRECCSSIRFSPRNSFSNSCAISLREGAPEIFRRSSGKGHTLGVGMHNFMDESRSPRPTPFGECGRGSIPGLKGA